MEINSYRGSLIKIYYVVDGKEFERNKLPDSLKRHFDAADKGAFTKFRNRVIATIGENTPGIIKIYPSNIFRAFRSDMTEILL